jgi:hypothetical protein
VVEFSLALAVSIGTVILVYAPEDIIMLDMAVPD